MDTIFTFSPPLTVIFYSTALFVAVILSLTIPPQRTKKFLQALAVVIAISALGLYGYGYSFYTEDDELLPLTIRVLKATMATCRIFVGSNAWDDVKTAIKVCDYAVIYFWLIHFLAFVTSASAIITTLGFRLLKQIRIRLFRWRNLSLIYGLNEKTLGFGRDLIKQEHAAVVYVDPDGNSALHTAADQMGAIVMTDPHALTGDRAFLKTMGVRLGLRKLHVYALSESLVNNQLYAQRLLDSLKTGVLNTNLLRISPEQITLTIIESCTEHTHPLQNKGDDFGYSSIISVNEPEMVARTLVQSFPPCRQLKFNKVAQATSNFYGIVIGCGAVGQAVLRHMVMNSQFQGVPDSQGNNTYRSRIEVFAPDVDAQFGFMTHEYRYMMQHYGIKKYAYDGRSIEFYKYLSQEENIKNLNYVAVCTGSDAMNAEICQQLRSFLQHNDCDAPVLMCTHKGVFHYADQNYITSHKIYTPELLSPNRVDDPAMLLNYAYCMNNSFTPIKKPDPIKKKMADIQSILQNKEISCKQKVSYVSDVIKNQYCPAKKALSVEELKALVGDVTTDWEVKPEEEQLQITKEPRWPKRKVLKQWYACEYFDRMSSRAAADFQPSLRFCADPTGEQPLESWNPQGEKLTNLAITEHLRWEAFHYCMGFTPMTEEEYDARLNNFNQIQAMIKETDEAKKQEMETALKEKLGPEYTPKYRVTKNMFGRTHACLIPWDQLDILAKKETLDTNTIRKYKREDRKNVLMIRRVLMQQEKYKK